MDLEGIFGSAVAAARAQHEKAKCAEIREGGCVPVGAFAARLLKKWPSKALVDAGEIEPREMDGEGALPELTLYRPHKKAVQIFGRDALDNLADLLTSNGYGAAGRAQKRSEAK